MRSNTRVERDGPDSLMSPGILFPSQECGVSRRISSDSIPEGISLPVKLSSKPMNIFRQMYCSPVQSMISGMAGLFALNRVYGTNIAGTEMVQVGRESKSRAGFLNQFVVSRSGAVSGLLKSGRVGLRGDLAESNVRSRLIMSMSVVRRTPPSLGDRTSPGTNSRHPDDTSSHDVVIPQVPSEDRVAGWMDDVGVVDPGEEDEGEYDPQFFGPSIFVGNSDRASSQDDSKVGNQGCLASQEKVPDTKDVRRLWLEQMKDEGDATECLTIRAKWSDCEMVSKVPFVYNRTLVQLASPGIDPDPFEMTASHRPEREFEKLRPVGPVNDSVFDATFEPSNLTEDVESWVLNIPIHMHKLDGVESVVENISSDITLVEVEEGVLGVELGANEAEAPGSALLLSMLLVPHFGSIAMSSIRRVGFELHKPLLVRLGEVKRTYIKMVVQAPSPHTRAPLPCVDSLPPLKFDLRRMNRYQEVAETIPDFFCHPASCTYLEQVAESIQGPIEKGYKSSNKDSHEMVNNYDRLQESRTDARVSTSQLIDGGICEVPTTRMVGILA